MTPKDIKIELMKAGVTQADISRQSGRSRAQVCRVINNNECVSDPVRRAVAAAINRDVSEVWPEYYQNRRKRA